MRLATCGASISLAVFLQSSDNALGPTNVNLIARVPSRRASNTTKIRSSALTYLKAPKASSCHNRNHEKGSIGHETR